MIENWRVEYNTDRPHSAPGYLTRRNSCRLIRKKVFYPWLYVGAD
ncbi:integrase core domain protein [Bordetella holmesii 70147]|nr:integrase core domain protein [Bordetella holmesii 70147]